MNATPLHIGIVACSAEGAALCYRTLCTEGAERLGPHAHPEISLHTHSLADYVACLDRADLAGVGALMLSSAGKLARAGADFLICPDNTIHQALGHVLPQSPLPWLHIAEEVAAEAQARGLRRIGILGTRWLVDSSVYPDKLDARGLSVALAIVNLGDTPMPCGLGLHPYFTAERVTLHARREWPADADGLPAGSKSVHVRELRRSASGCDTYLSQWAGRATLHWPDGHQLSLHADPAFAHLVVYTAGGSEFLCVEPVTNVADAFNLAASGEARSGMRVLEPGARFTATALFGLEPPRAARS